MLPQCRITDPTFASPTFDVTPSDVGGWMDELRDFQAVFHDCFARGESQAHFFDDMAGQLCPLARKSIEPMAFQGLGGSIWGLQRFISDVP